jgi:hypothetical protein
MVKPITPREVVIKKEQSLPNEVIDVFNELIAENFNGRCSIVMQDDAAKRIALKMNVSVDHLYKNRLLDVETVFRKAGWKVEYNNPFNESYKAFFIFTNFFRT